MMFLDCPAYLDQDGTARCGLPAEVSWWFTMSTDGPLESARIRCPVGHWFNGPVEFLTWKDAQHGNPDAPALARRSRGSRGPTGGPTRGRTGTPGREGSRPSTVPPYYLGRPASLWISAMHPRRRGTSPDHLTSAVTSG